MDRNLASLVPLLSGRSMTGASDVSFRDPGGQSSFEIAEAFPSSPRWGAAWENLSERQTLDYTEHKSGMTLLIRIKGHP